MAAAPDAYDDLLDHYRRISNVGGAQGILHWDQQVAMPSGGTPARSQQLSTLSAIAHEELTDDRVGEWLDECEAADLEGREAANVREIRREYERATRVPTDLVEELSETTSEAMSVWREAREDDDFGAFEPYLADIVELKRDYANHIDPDADPYEVLFADYEPYLSLETAERVLERLRDRLVPLIDEIEATDTTLAEPFTGEFDPDAQEELARDVLTDLGYDWDHGRLDTAPHPFSTGTPYDARVTTRFDPADPVDALMSTVHEFGHATYTLGLPTEEFGEPAGESRDLTVHESQSRFWENHVGRTRAYWDHLLPTMAEYFPQVEDVTPREAYEAANQIYPENLIRVEADELTYHLHIILRFEMERDLIAGDLDVADVPGTWNAKMDDYLGVTPPDDADGCLQDVHWSQGSIGYFPTYSLGSVLAAQLHAHADDDLGGIDPLVRDGDFAPVHDWLTDHVHRHGKRYTTPELVREATGEDYTADHFLDYAESKYRRLYDL